MNQKRGKEKRITFRLPKTWRPRVVVIGGGFAGLSFLKNMKQADAQLVLIDKNNYHVFRPLIYQVATAGLEPGAISNSLRGMFHHQKNVHFRKTEARKVLIDKYRVITSAGAIDYDYLVLAGGSTGNFFGNRPIEKNALTINNMQDALDIREKFIQNLEEALMSRKADDSALMNVVIVGGGPTGVELAGALAELRKNVLPKDYPDFNTDHLTIHLVEAKKRLLPEMSERSGQKARKYLVSLGVKIRTDIAVKDCNETTIWLSDGTEIKSNLLLWAAGMKGNLLEGFSEDQLHRGRMIVDEFNRVRDTKNVFAIGDIALQKQEDYEQGLPMLAPVAIQQSKHLAQNLKRWLNDKRMLPFNYKDKGVMATVGRDKAVVELPGNITFGGKPGWLIWMFVHLISIIGLRRKLVVVAHWIWSYFTYDKGNRLILRRSNNNS